MRAIRSGNCETGAKKVIFLGHFSSCPTAAATEVRHRSSNGTRCTEMFFHTVATSFYPNHTKLNMPLPGETVCFSSACSSHWIELFPSPDTLRERLQQIDALSGGAIDNFECVPIYQVLRFGIMLMNVPTPQKA